MLVLSLRGQTSNQIAQNVLCSQDTVVRVLKRFFTGGLDAVSHGALLQAESDGSQPPGKPGGSRVIELDPREVGQDTANWTTERLADVERHFQALAQAPTEILRHIGSPFAPEKDQDAPLSLAQAA